MLRPAPNSIQVGDTVFASNWQDGDWNDLWVVGIVLEVGGDYVKVGNNDGQPFQGVKGGRFRYAIALPKSQLLDIRSEWIAREGTDFDIERAKEMFRGATDQEILSAVNKLERAIGTAVEDLLRQFLSNYKISPRYIEVEIRTRKEENRTGTEAVLSSVQVKLTDLS